MKTESFVLPVTVNGKKIKAAGTKFKPAKDTLYRVSVPWGKWDKAFIFTLTKETPPTLHYYKMNDKQLDEIAETIKNKLEKLTI